MIEATTNIRTQDAMRAAHEARGDAIKEFWHWLRKTRTSE